MKRNWIILVVGYSLAMVLSLAGGLKALPEYGVRYGQSCQLCHVSVAGGGERSAYGSKFFSFNELPAHPTEFSELESIQNSIGDKIQIGVDFRDLFYFSHNATMNQDANSFLTMEGNIYLSFALSENMTLALSKGLYGGYDAYAEWNGGLGKPHVKAGYFMPNYGWHFDDHRTFTRRFTGFGGELGVGQREDGIEGGIASERWDVSATLTNGSGASIVDNNAGKAATLRAASRFPLGGVQVTGGISWRYEEIGTSALTGRRMGGFFYGLSRGPVSLLGEADWISTDVSSFATSQLLYLEAKQGWYVCAGYGFYDPDTHTGGVNWLRGRLSLAWIPEGYFSVEPGIEWLREPQGDVLTPEIMLHLWY